MKGSIGAATSIYHTRLPHQWKLERMASEISKEAILRLRWMDHHRYCGNARATCREFGISHTTFYKWKRRFDSQGIPGLESRSRAPLGRRKSTVPRELVSLVVKIRKEYPAWSKHKIAVILRRDHGVVLSASTVGRILKRKGLYSLGKSRARKRNAKRLLKRKRAEKWRREAYPGSLIQVDTKHLSYAGRTYYQFTAVDCFTRMGYMRVYPSAASKWGADFLDRLTDFLPFSIAGVQTDNGPEYLGSFDEAVRGAGIDHYFSYPCCPKHNARVERKIQTSEYEFWDFKAGYSVEELDRLAMEWNYVYNLKRPHQSLGYLTPMEYLECLEEKSKQTGRVSTM